MSRPPEVSPYLQKPVRPLDEVLREREERRRRTLQRRNAEPRGGSHWPHPGRVARLFLRNRDFANDP